jgi:ABC-type multidrug transport system fused ATPase/permease subunit
MEHGRIRETGPHAALASADGPYAALLTAQGRTPQRVR